MIAPLPEISFGSCFVQGRYGSGARTVEKTFTTEFSMACDGVSDWAGDEAGEVAVGGGAKGPNPLGRPGSIVGTAVVAGSGAAAAVARIHDAAPADRSARKRPLGQKMRFML